MDHSGMDMGGMDMGSNSTSDSSSMDMGMGACKISMLWNWYTVDTCFLSSSWHNNTKAKFAGSVIGVFLLVIAIEGLRRLARDYDRHITRQAMATHALVNGDGGSTPNVGGSKDIVEGQCIVPFNFTPSWLQHGLRAFAYGTQFTVSFLVMLLGMYYNGYILFAIFIGHTVGYFAFARDTAGSWPLAVGWTRDSAFGTEPVTYLMSRVGKSMYLVGTGDVVR